jgi:hypothetical protein
MWINQINHELFFLFFFFFLVGVVVIIHKKKGGGAWRGVYNLQLPWAEAYFLIARAQLIES